jgi:nucleoside-diphosphate-sugar epimerase
MKIAITGGSGFVGGHLCSQFRAAGHEAVALVGFRLQGPVDEAALAGFDVLIHAAWDLTENEDGRNVTGSIRLIDAAKRAGIGRIVFISSLSAFEGCKSRYGATKMAVERHVASVGACSVRLGFLCDDTGRGLSGSLKKLAALPLVPLPGGGAQNLFTIWAEDLGPSFAKVIERGAGRVVNLANPEPVSLKRMMRAFGPDAKFLPFPWRLLWLPLRFAEACGLKLKFRSDSLVSLMNQNPSPDFRLLREWDIELKSFGNGH